MKNTPNIFYWIGISFLAIFLAVISKQQPTNYNTQNATIPLIQPSLKAAIQKGFQKGNVEMLYPHFDEIISICIADEEEIYLAYNAKAALSHFFQTYPPKKFELSHDGQSKGKKEAFWIGDYVSENGMHFRVYILSEKDLIQNIEIANKPTAS